MSLSIQPELTNRIELTKLATGCSNMMDECEKLAEKISGSIAIMPLATSTKRKEYRCSILTNIKELTNRTLGTVEKLLFFVTECTNYQDQYIWSSSTVPAEQWEAGQKNFAVLTRGEKFLTKVTEQKFNFALPDAKPSPLAAWVCPFRF